MGRVLRRLSRPLKIRSFLVGLGRCDAKTMDLPLFHTLLQIRLQSGISNKFRLRLQPSRESLQRRIQMRTSAGEPTSRRPATIPRDENLEANPRRRRKAQGGTEATTRSILELSAAAIPSPVVFIADPATSRMARQADCRPRKKQRAPKSPMSKPSDKPENRHNASAQGG